MAWTNFTSLGIGPGTTPQLDANFLTLSELINLPCAVSGTNTLVLTQSTTTAVIPSYLNYMSLECIAASTNTTGVTANFNSLGTLNIYKDTASGPVVLTGGEIVQNCQFTLVYDLALNSGAGGFHLRGGGNGSAGGTITAASINATLGSINSFSVSNLYGASGSITSLTAVNFLGTSASLANVLIGGGSVTLSALQMGTIANAVTRLQSTLTSFSIVSGNALVPGAEVSATISFSGCVVGDNILAQPPTPSASLQYIGYVGAAGSIIFRVHNMATAATVTVSLFTVRFTDIGFAS